MTKKQVLILTALVVFVLLEVAVFFLGGFGERGEEAGLPVGGLPGEEIVVPEEEQVFTPEVRKEAEETKAEITVPTVSSEEKASLGVYSITASRTGYSPDEIVTRQGNSVQIRLTSSGGTYDIHIPYIGVYLSAPEGETKQISFKITTPGTFKFECRDFCPATKISGKIIVLPAEE